MSRDGDFLSELPARLQAALPGYLPDRRWFGDKARSIASVDVTEVVPITEVDFPSALVIITVHFRAGDPATYALAVAQPATAPGSRDAIIVESEHGYLVDGLTDASLRRRLLTTIAGASSARVGSLVADVASGASEALSALAEGESRLLRAEQSNTSILYGDEVLIKLFRRLQPGVNPDVELTRFLSSRAKFESVPRYLGSISHRSTGGGESVLACAQAFIPNVGDGWTFVLEAIRRHLAEPDARALLAGTWDLARELGVVTAQMHLALASDPWSPDLAPEPIKRPDAERWSVEYLGLIDRVVTGLTGRFDALDPKTSELATLFLEGEPGLRKRNGGFFRLIGRSKLRVHGDFHLGQTLRTLDDRFVIIDFEGEPQRSIEERRRKTSPLKDVAGMLRSFSYARGTATAWLEETTRLLPSDLVAWERETRDAFLSGYVETARAGNAAFLPESSEDLNEALAAWELDKAAYEVLYEINNRPDWLWIPLSGMLKRGEPET